MGCNSHVIHGDRTMMPAPISERDNLATCTQLEANVALAEWQQQQRAFEATLAAVEAALNEPQQVPA
jgi:hypothetical protein